MADNKTVEGVDAASSQPESAWKRQAASTVEGSKAAGLLDAVKEQTARAAEQQKEAGAEQIDSMARAVHGVADTLGTEMPSVSTYVHDAASRLDRASAGLRQASMDDVLAKLSQFARKQPAIFFGTAVFAGLALSRFLKSTAAKQD